MRRKATAFPGTLTVRWNRGDIVGITPLVSQTRNVYRDRHGRIILEPQASVPAAEAWLFRNKSAQESVARGLRQLASGKEKVIGSFAEYADDDEA